MASTATDVSLWMSAYHILCGPFLYKSLWGREEAHVLSVMRVGEEGRTKTAAAETKGN